MTLGGVSVILLLFFIFSVFLENKQRCKFGVVMTLCHYWICRHFSCICKVIHQGIQAESTRKRRFQAIWILEKSGPDLPQSGADFSNMGGANFLEKSRPNLPQSGADFVTYRTHFCVIRAPIWRVGGRFLAAYL
jgi:hypothetical protein